MHFEVPLTIVSNSSISTFDIHELYLFSVASFGVLKITPLPNVMIYKSPVNKTLAINMLNEDLIWNIYLLLL